MSTPDEVRARHLAELAERRAKPEAIKRTVDHLIGLINSSFPGAEDLKDLEALRWIHAGTVPAARSSALTLAAQQYVYARGKIDDIKSGAQSSDYDPSADPGWPS